MATVCNNHVHYARRQTGDWPKQLDVSPRTTALAQNPGPAVHTKPLTVTLLVPTLNEIVGMKGIMPLIGHDWVDQILILDGGSTDGTIEWARDNGYTGYVQTEA